MSLETWESAVHPHVEEHDAQPAHIPAEGGYHLGWCAAGVGDDAAHVDLTCGFDPILFGSVLFVGEVLFAAVGGGATGELGGRRGGERHPGRASVGCAGFLYAQIAIAATRKAQN